MDGTSSTRGSSAIASRNARANALNIASTMWCGSPCASIQTCAVSFALFATARKNSSARPSSKPPSEISGNGAFVSFLSASTNWDGTDTNGLFDVYVKGVGAGGAPSRVSVSSAGAQANAESSASAISYNGDAVAFVSYASNLVSGDTNGQADVFVRVRSAGQTARVDELGAQQANGSVGSSGLRFSGNPSNAAFSFLVFDSSATNLTSNDTNGFIDVFSAALSP